MDVTRSLDDLTADTRPAWARRMRQEREARGWSQNDAVKALRAHGDFPLPTHASLLRQWKRWEAGEVEPAEYKPAIAKTFGTVTGAFFPQIRDPRTDGNLIAATGLDTLELVARIQASDVSPATLEALRITADRLCCEYAYADSGHLAVEGRAWLRRITSLLDRRLTLSQHREVLSLAGTITLLVGCVEYDQGLRGEAEATRRAAYSLGEESGRNDVMGWAQEMRCWFALTQGDLRSVVAAGQTGRDIAPHHSVAVQLAAQQAKAWARLGDRRQVEVALNEGRQVLESQPHPENTDHHFVVDPAKFDFYAMDCYRILKEDALATLYAEEVLRSAVGFDGVNRSPMRAAEAQVTLGVAAVRAGELTKAIGHGRAALAGDRKSLPSLAMVAQDLSGALQADYPNEPETREFTDELQALTVRA